jgi:hypothetical protein
MPVKVTLVMVAFGFFGAESTGIITLIRRFGFCSGTPPRVHTVVAGRSRQVQYWPPSIRGA